MHEFEQIDISGDAGIRAFGKDCVEAFSNAGIGMYSLMTDLSKIGDDSTIEIAVTAETPEGLLVRYLNELIFRFDAYNFVGRRIDIHEFSECSLRAKVFGSEFDPEDHEQRLLIKAATYHSLKVRKGEKGCEAEVIFDI